MPTLLHKPEQAAEELCVSRATLFELIRRGELESVLIGRSRRVPHESLVRYVERLRAEHGSAPAA